MTEHWQEWDSDEFQAALKVVLKCEIQSLLERLSETGEETVLLTASTADRCVDHLASANALKFVNTADIGMIKNKFLHFLTFSGVGAQPPAARKSMPGSSVVAGKPAESSGVICNNRMGKGPTVLPKTDLPVTKSVDSKIGAAAGEAKNAVKRVLDAGPMSPVDPKRRKIKTETPPQMFASQPAITSGSLLASTPTAASIVKSQATAPVLKTTKVVSKSGGFTEERFSNSEYQKLLAQYNPNDECNEEDDDGGYGDDDVEDDDDETIGMFMPQLAQQSQFQHNKVTSVHNTLNKVTSLTNSLTDKTVSSVNQSGSNQSMQQKLLNQSNDLKKENSSLNVKKIEDNSVNKENKECMRILNVTKTELVTERKELNDEVNISQTSSSKDSDQVTGKDQDKVGIVQGNPQMPAGPADNMGSQNRNRLESIDNLDTETLIQMTKAKHLETMSAADREIQAKLGQLSSKLNWVVEYPKGKGPSAGRGRGSPGQRPHVTEGPGLPAARLGLHGPYHGIQAAEMEGMEDEDFDEDDDDDDDEFDEDDLDDEDKAALKAMREAHMRKLGNSGNIEEFGDDGGMYAEGFGVSQGFHAYPEGYAEGEEDYEGYEDYNSGEEMEVHMGLMRDSNRIHGTLPSIGVPMVGLGEGTNVSGLQKYQRTASPTSENFLMIGQKMAKCLICNKIVRKTEMRLHHESHLNEEYNEEEEEEEEGMEPGDEEAQVFGKQKQILEEGEFEEGDGEYPPCEGEYPPGEREYPPGESEYPPGEREYPPGEREYPPGEREYPPDDGNYPSLEGEYHQDDGDYPPDEGEYSEDYEAECGPEFTAEKFVAEKLDDVSMDVSRISNNDGKMTCDICSKSFKSIANMIRHRKNIHNIHEAGSEVKELSQNSPCPCCGKTFRYLQKHLKKMHPDFKESQSAESESSFKCGVCGDQFSDDDALKEHFKIHT